MVIEKIKLRNVVDDLIPSINTVHCCYFNEGNLQVRCGRLVIHGKYIYDT